MEAYLKPSFMELGQGFLDGGAGFVIAFGNFEGTFYRYLKLTEYESKWKAPEAKEVKKISN